MSLRPYLVLSQPSQARKALNKLTPEDVARTWIEIHGQIPEELVPDLIAKVGPAVSSHISILYRRSFLKQPTPDVSYLANLANICHLQISIDSSIPVVQGWSALNKLRQLRWFTMLGSPKKSIEIGWLKQLALENLSLYKVPQMKWESVVVTLPKLKKLKLTCTDLENADFVSRCPLLESLSIHAAKRCHLEGISSSLLTQLLMNSISEVYGFQEACTHFGPNFQYHSVRKVIS